MQVELFGCTGSGKSTLASRFLRAARNHGLDAVMSDDLVLEVVRMHRLRNRLARTLVVDLIAFGACVFAWRRHAAFRALALRLIRQVPAAPWGEKLNLTRNALKKIGIYELVRRRGRDERVVLIDEGTLQTAHNLFVHLSLPPSMSDLASFAQLVPLPSVAVYVSHREPVLVSTKSAPSGRIARSAMSLAGIAPTAFQFIPASVER